MTKTKILYLSSSPSNLGTLGSDEEFRAIHENINDDLFKIQSVSNTKISDIQAVICESQPDIIHFSGHGSSEDIIFETDRNESAGAFKPAFIRIFQNLKKKPKLIFLNACQTHDNLDDLSYIIDFVIATDRKVSDPAAIMFARNFYRFLSLGVSVKSSFNLTVNQFEIGSSNAEAEMYESQTREAVYDGNRCRVESLTNEAKMYRLLIREGADSGWAFEEGNGIPGKKSEPSKQKNRQTSKHDPENPVIKLIDNYKNRIGNQNNYQTGDGTTINYNQKDK